MRAMCSCTSTTTRPTVRHVAGIRSSPFCQVWGCALRSSRWSCALMTLLLGACELDKTAIPRTDPKLALSGVLSASASTQVVLLERTRTGRVNPVTPPFDLEDPIGSDEGIAESGATM